MSLSRVDLGFGTIMACLALRAKLDKPSSFTSPGVLRVHKSQCRL